jgi:ribulose-phosphate 3-epimerase
MIEIIPSILTADPAELIELLAKCEGRVERVQIDIIDGVFAENKTIEPLVLENYEGNIKFDYHLMVKDPINWVEKSIRGGADRIVGQIEMMSSQTDFITKVSEVGCKVGLGIDFDTPVSDLDNVIIRDLDVVLVMSVEAGFGGQKFDPSALLRVNQLSDIRNHVNSPFRIQLDGGVRFDIIHEAIQSGADEAVIGRRLFEGDLTANIRKFQEAAYRLDTSY